MWSCYIRKTFFQAIEALCEHDCKSLTDALLVAGGAATKTSEDKRLRIELSMIKRRLSRIETRFQWVEGAYTCSHQGQKNEITSSFCGSCLRTARYQIPCHLRDVGGKDGKLVNESDCDTKNADEQASDDIEKHL